MFTFLSVGVLLAVSTSFEELAKRAAEARDQERLEEAARLYRQALRLKPGWAEGWWFLGTLAYDQDQYSGCSDAFHHLVDLKPEGAPGHALLGLCEFNLKRYDSSLRHLLHAQKIGFGGETRIRQVALYHLALAFILKEHYENAIEQLALLVRSSEAAPDVRLAAGIATLRRPILPSQIPGADRDLAARLGQAVVEELGRHPEEAMQAYEAVLAAYPRAPGVHYAYGSFLLSSNPDRGLELLKQELDISPEHVPALGAIALEYLKRGDAASAKPWARKAVQLAPGDFVTHVAWGRVLFELEDLPAAIRELELAVQLAPDSPHARFALANAYVRAGRKQDADRERKEFARLRKLLDSEGK